MAYLDGSWCDGFSFPPTLKIFTGDFIWKSTNPGSKRWQNVTKITRPRPTIKFSSKNRSSPDQDRGQMKRQPCILLDGVKTIFVSDQPSARWSFCVSATFHAVVTDKKLMTQCLEVHRVRQLDTHDRKLATIHQHLHNKCMNFATDFTT